MRENIRRNTAMMHPDAVELLEGSFSPAISHGSDHGKVRRLPMFVMYYQTVTIHSPDQEKRFGAPQNMLGCWGIQDTPRKQNVRSAHCRSHHRRHYLGR